MIPATERAPARPRLIASDLDGTLLGRDGLLSPRTIRALQLARDSGIDIVIATGRPGAAFQPLLKAGFTGVVLAQNGAVIHDLKYGTHRVRGAISPEVLRAAVDLLETKVPGIQLAIQVTDDQGERHYADHKRPSSINYRLLPREQMFNEPVVRALVWHPDPLGSFDWFPSAFDLVHATHSHSRSLLELSAPGITKAAALAEHAFATGVTAAEVMAFGDMFNDVEMLAWAGWGVAMGNAPVQVQSAADAVTTPHHEDGVAAYLEGLLSMQPQPHNGAPR